VSFAPDGPVENAALEAGLAALGSSLPEAVRQGLLRYLGELLKWNQKVNLTAITEPREAIEKHLVDALAVLPEVRAAQGPLLDLGTGAGLPGIPLALAIPTLEATLVDAVAKKVAFVKAAVAVLGLAPRVKARHLHAEGRPEKEGLGLAGLVVARAFTEPAGLLELATPYLAPGGAVLAMLGRHPDRADLEALAAAKGYRLSALRTYLLPVSRAERAAAVFHRA